MSKTMELTPELQAKLPGYLQKFDKLCLNTSPCDRPKAEKVMTDVYAHLAALGIDGFNTPPTFTWVDSPLVGAKLAAQWVKNSDDVTDEEIQAQAHYVSFGSMESYWIGIYSFINDYMVNTPEPLAELAVRIVEECGPFWVFEGHVLMVERPSYMNVENGELHATDRKALEYPNGDGLFVFKGQLKRSLIEVVMAARNYVSGTTS